MTVYYNEFEPYAAQWLRNLIAAGHLPAGDVDERDIREVKPDDLRAYTQCHFFAGIGGWSLALRLAGWPDDRPVWTGSCPCQPFSSAGKRKGQADERHLWPAWFRLIKECRPARIYGEQVAAAIAHGWLDEVAVCLEEESYTIGAAVLPACAAGAFHRRDRLWFMADSKSKQARVTGQPREHINVANPTNRMHKAKRTRGDERRHEETLSRNIKAGAMANTRHQRQEKCKQQASGSEQYSKKSLGDTNKERLQRNRRGERGVQVQEERENEIRPAGYANGVSWVECPDGKCRAIKPGIRLLAHRIPARVGKLRAFGNAIDPRIAVEFIKATEEVIYA